MIENEVFKDIEGYNGVYQISNKGNVKSFKYGREKLLRLYINAYGYQTTTISVNGKCIKLHIHKLVYSHFGKKVLNGKTLHHKDGNKSNNHIDNLEILTRKDHSKIHGFTGINGNDRNGSLTKKQAIEVKMLLKLGCLTINNIAAMYNVCHVTVSKLKNKDTKSTLGI